MRCIMQKECDFCLEFSDGHGNEKTLFNNLFPDISNRVIFSTENFVVFPTIGQMVEGFLHIIPQKHYFSMGELPHEMWPELNWLTRKTVEILKSVYKKRQASMSPCFREKSIGKWVYSCMAAHWKKPAPFLKAKVSTPTGISSGTFGITWSLRVKFQTQVTRWSS